MQDRPTAGELLDALRAFLEKDILANTSGRRQFHTRVAINVVNILRREWEQEEEMVTKEWQRLASLLEAGEPPGSFGELRGSVGRMNAELSKKIRAGEFDHRWEEAVTSISETVKDKLRVANPEYMRDQKQA